jgi:hypothetical protein
MYIAKSYYSTDIFLQLNYVHWHWIFWRFEMSPNEMLASQVYAHTELGIRAMSLEAFLLREVGRGWVHLVRRPLLYPLYQHRVIEEYEAVGGIRISSWKRSTLRKPVTVSIYIEIFGIHIAILSREYQILGLCQCVTNKPGVVVIIWENQDCKNTNCMV